MTKFSPKNKVQRLAYGAHNIKSAAEFEKVMVKRGVARTTARYWWDNGVPSSADLENIQAMADYLNVSLGELLGG